MDGDSLPTGVERSLPPFSAVNVNLSALVELVHDTSNNAPYVSLIVEGNLAQHLSTEVENDTLNITLEYCFSSHANIIVRVHYDSLTTLIISGPGDIVSKSKFVQPLLNLDIRSSGNMDLTMDVDQLNSKINGTGSIYLNGQVKNHTITHNNSGTINTYQAMTDTVHLEMTGSGNAYVRVKKELNVNILNSGDTYYKGYPAIKDIISGSGKLIDDN